MLDSFYQGARHLSAGARGGLYWGTLHNTSDLPAPFHSRCWFCHQFHAARTPFHTHATGQAHLGCSTYPSIPAVECLTLQHGVPAETSSGLTHVQPQNAGILTPGRLPCLMGMEPVDECSPFSFCRQTALRCAS